MLAALLSLGFLAGIAQAAPTPAPAAAKSKFIKMKSDKSDYDEKLKKVRLIGNVVVLYDKMTLTAPYAESYSDKKMAEFQGGVKMVGEGSTATGKLMKAFYLEKRVILTGDVRLVTERGPGAQSGSPSVLLCSELDYNWGTGLGKAKGRVRVRQGNRRAVADRATYQKSAQIVDLEGNVEFERGEDDWLTCSKARMDLAAQTIVAEGGVVARTRMDEPKKDEKAPEKPSQARPVPIEPKLPYKAIEIPPQIQLPGVDPIQDPNPNSPK
jgi:lipopolysaccharide export system protein LptA